MELLLKTNNLKLKNMIKPIEVELSDEFKQASLPDVKVMFNALVERDNRFEGVFVVGVKTTGICCRPTCNARKPKFENVEYFHHVKQALSFGYRPCRVCNPLQPFGIEPDWLKPLLKRVNQDPEVKLKDYDLREMGLEPTRVRRWFKKHHGMTFQAYTRGLRINRAFGLIKHKNSDVNDATTQPKTSIVDTAMASGFESLSGFNDAFKKITGSSPSQSKGGTIVTINRLTTPLGPMFAGVTDKGLCLLEFTDRRMLETQLTLLSKKMEAKLLPGEHPLFEQLDRQLKQYFNGERKVFELPLDLPSTDFQQQVWQALLSIPYGQTRSYQQQAELINNPKAIRAVAKANGDNRISIIIPCHRVIGKNGKLTGYGGGLWRKQRLLALEKEGIKLN
jgi:AraC family transcriptional regulator, regulatory protein of adaptative response / methylated-DNA-[protein]-cysteine methyltransferase